MKRFLIILLILPTLLALSVDLQRTLEIYGNFLEMYKKGDFSHPFLELLNRELQNLSLYRYYKSLLDKSVDRRETNPDLGSYIARIYDAAFFEDENEQLAASIFLAYLASKLSHAKFTSEMIMKNDAVVKFFTNYRDVVTKEARSFFSWIVSYQLGLCEERPPVEVEVETVELPEEITYRFTPPSNLVHIKDLTLFYADPAVQNTLKEAVPRAKQNIIADPSRAMVYINREANFLARDIFKPVTAFQTQIAKEAVKITPVKSNLSWLRFLAYGILIYLFRKRVKVLMILISIVLALEILLFLFFFEPFSTYQGLAYGLVAIFGLCFSAILIVRRFISRKNILDFLFLIALVVVLSLPLIRNCESLSMESFSSLRESVYYSTLKKELFEDELSKVFQLTRSLATTLYVSIDETNKLFNELFDTFVDAYNLKAFDELTFSPRPFIRFANESAFYSGTNFEQRLNLFRNVNRPLESFLLDESSRRSQFERNFRNLKRHLQRMLAYSADFLRSDIVDYVERLFTTNYPILSNVFPKLELLSYQGTSVKSPDIPIYKEITSLKILIAVILILVAQVLIKPIYVLPATSLTLIYVIFEWFNMDKIRIFVEQGLPIIELPLSQAFIPGIFVLVVGLFVINILKLLAKGERA